MEPGSDPVEPEPRECVDDDGSSSRGCSFVVAPVLHLVDPISEDSDVPPEQWEHDGVFVANPDPAVATIEVWEIARDELDEVRIGEPVALLPGERVLVELPDTAQREGTELRSGGLLRITSDVPVSASLYGPHRPFLGNDSALLLPDAALGERYVVLAFPPHIRHFQGLGDPSYFEIVATEDDTRVRWRPQQASTVAGPGVPEVAAGQWSPEVVLQRHQALLVAATDDPNQAHDRHDVSGTVIEASAPVRVLSGSRCAAVPVSSVSGAGCDPVFEQLVPTAAWGQTYVVPHPPLRTTELHHLRIFAGADGVQVWSQPSVLPGEPLLLASEGDFVDVIVAHGVSFVLEADGPVMPVGYLQTRDELVEVGDPAMIQMVPIEQFLPRYVLATSSQWQVHYVQVIRRAGAAEVRLDGVALGGWEPIEAWELTTVAVDEGAYAVESDEAVGVLQYGWTNAVHEACVPYAPQDTCQTSYAHPGGMGLRRLR